MSDNDLRIRGKTILPGEAGYDELRKTFAHEGQPRMIVQCLDAEDVKAALEYARANKLQLSVRGGGHSFAGLSTNDGGLVLDLSPMHTIEIIDTAKRIVRIGGGATWRQVTEALHGHGLALSSGDTRTVGVGGLMLGGGVGWMVRKFGLAIDSLVAAEVVTANGKVLRVSEQEHSDLFWAIRGGGGNFGVVTAFEVVTYPVETVFTGDIVYPIEQIGQVLKGWRDNMRTSSEDLTTILRVIPPLPGVQPAVVVSYCHASANEEEAAADLKPFRALGKELQFGMKRIPYKEMITDHPTPPPGMQMQATSGFIREANDEMLDAVAQEFGKPGSPILQLRSIGGAMNRVPADATAFGFRDCEVMAVAVMVLPPDAPKEAIAQTAAWQSLAPFTIGSYSNFLSDSSPVNIRSSYPQATYERLLAIKKQYDPDSLFTGSHLAG